ncbi:hypothetical protein CXG81DRAFT_11754, partial [Caulochytrium protostelioides]
RSSAQTAALVLKINVKTLRIELDERLDALDSLEPLTDALPDAAPRYILLSYALRHADGRTSYPLVGIAYLPHGCNDASRMLFASNASWIFERAGIGGRIHEVRDAEQLTDAWLTQQITSSLTRA